MLKRMFRLAAILALAAHAGSSEAQYTVAGAAAAGAPLTALLVGTAVVEGVLVYWRGLETTGMSYARVPEFDPKRRVNVQDCSKPVDLSAGNLRCGGAESGTGR